MSIANYTLRKEKEKIQKQNKIEKTRVIIILFFILLPHHSRREDPLTTRLKGFLYVG